MEQLRDHWTVSSSDHGTVSKSWDSLEIMGQSRDHGTASRDHRKVSRSRDSSMLPDQPKVARFDLKDPYRCRHFSEICSFDSLCSMKPFILYALMHPGAP